MIALVAHGQIQAALGGDSVLGAEIEAVLAALGLPRGWQQRLARAFGMPDQLKTALADLAAGGKAAAENGAVADLVLAGDRAALVAHVRATMAATGISPSAGRSPAEIAARLMEKAELASTRLAPGAMGLLIDWGWQVDGLGLACGLYCVAASALSALAGHLPA